MPSHLWTSIVGVLAASVAANVLPVEYGQVSAVDQLGPRRRALPNSPDGYTPTYLECPRDVPTVRSAASLSPNETAWLEKRRNNTVEPMRDLLTRLNISDFNATAYIDRAAQNASALPTIAIALSGGGWRALMNGAGAVKAFDSRTENNTGPGQLGGLLDSSLFIAGLSGGSWLVGSLFVNNYSTVAALQADTTGSVWEFGNSIIEGPASNGSQIVSTADYYGQLAQAVTGKEDAGFDISITDLWGRALSYQLINATEGGPAYTWSSLHLSPAFQQGDQPFPIVIADARAPGETLIPGNTTIYEFNAFEMGSWDPTAYGFVPTQYLGTNWTAGQVVNDSRCVVGFDNAGFIMGTSSSLFNQFLLNINSTSLPSSLVNFLNGVLGSISSDNNDIADYTPNPLFHYNPATNPSANSTRLTLVDGGEDLQNIPLHPLIQPNRHVDVIFAVDSSADTSNWPNATALVATYQRSLSDIANDTVFPSIPDQNTIVNLGLNTHPTFFGCNASNFTDGAPVPPLIVYIPNHPYVTYSNISTFQFKTNNTQRDAIILNGFDVATMANGTVDATWPTCVGCAILSRSFDRTGTAVPAACAQCFERFCWNGTLDSSTPAPYAPTLLLSEVSLEESKAVSLRLGRWAAAVALATTLVLCL